MKTASLDQIIKWMFNPYPPPHLPAGWFLRRLECQEHELITAHKCRP